MSSTCAITTQLGDGLDGVCNGKKTVETASVYLDAMPKQFQVTPAVALICLGTENAHAS